MTFPVRASVKKKPRRDAGRPRGEPIEAVVLARTLEELVEHGVDGASIDRIARAASVNKTSVYRQVLEPLANHLGSFEPKLANRFPKKRTLPLSRFDHDQTAVTPDNPHRNRRRPAARPDIEPLTRTWNAKSGRNERFDDQTVDRAVFQRAGQLEGREVDLLIPPRQQRKKPSTIGNVGL